MLLFEDERKLVKNSAYRESHAHLLMSVLKYLLNGMQGADKLWLHKGNMHLVSLFEKKLL